MSEGLKDRFAAMAAPLVAVLGTITFDNECSKKYTTTSNFCLPVTSLFLAESYQIRPQTL